MHRFFLPQIASDEKNLTIEDNKLIHQINNVLRLKIEDQIIVLNNQGQEITCQIENLSKKKINLKFIKSKNKNAKHKKKLNLFQAIPNQASKLELISQKATELGISSINPIITNRCQKQKTGKTDRLLNIIREASEQSERIFMPKLKDTITFEKAIEECRSQENIFAHERMKNKSFSLDITENNKNKEINIFIGPEGGWSKEEIILAEKNNFYIISLGPLILRTETAAIALISKIMI